MASKKYATIPEIAAERGVSTRTVRRWIAEGKLKATRYSPRVIRVETEELRRFDAAATA